MTGTTGNSATVAPLRFRGQSVVEFALVSLLLMTLVAGVVDLGRGVYTRTTLSNAVREAARYGSTNPEDADGIVAAAVNTSPGLDLAGGDPGITPTQNFWNNSGIIQCSDRNYAWLPPAKHNISAPLGLGLGVIAPALTVDRSLGAGVECLSRYYFLINGIRPNPETSLSGVTIEDVVHVTFLVSSTCTITSARLTVYIIDPNGPYTFNTGSGPRKYRLHQSDNGGPYASGARGDLEVTTPADDFYIEFVVNGGYNPSPSPVTPTATANLSGTATAVAGITATASSNQTATARANQTATASAGQTATASAGQTATASAGQTATAGAPLTATAGANQTATAGAAATSVAKTATAGAPGTSTAIAKTATAGAPLTATAGANQTATAGAKTATAGAVKTGTSVAKTQTAVAGLTATAAAGKTATAVYPPTATAAASATSAAGKTATAVYPATATAAVNQTATARAGQTATASAGQTATASAGQTATAVYPITATAAAVTATVRAGQTATAVAATQTATAQAGQTATAAAALTATAAGPFGATATAQAGQTATAILGATGTAYAIQTTVAGVGQTATAQSSSLTATAVYPGTATASYIQTQAAIAGQQPGAIPGTYSKQVDGFGNALPSVCDNPEVGKLMTVCASFEFHLALPKLIGFGAIPMKECATIDIQSVPR